MFGARRTRVTPAEVSEIVRLRDVERLSWGRIASRMSRAECTLRNAYERAAADLAWLELQAAT